MRVVTYGRQLRLHCVQFAASSPCVRRCAPALGLQLLVAGPRPYLVLKEGTRQDDARKEVPGVEGHLGNEAAGNTKRPRLPSEHDGHPVLRLLLDLVHTRACVTSGIMAGAGFAHLSPDPFRLSQDSVNVCTQRVSTTA